MTNPIRKAPDVSCGTGASRAPPRFLQFEAGCFLRHVAVFEQVPFSLQGTTTRHDPALSTRPVVNTSEVCTGRWRWRIEYGFRNKSISIRIVTSHMSGTCAVVRWGRDWRDTGHRSSAIHTLVVRIFNFHQVDKIMEKVLRDPVIVNKLNAILLTFPIHKRKK